MSAKGSSVFGLFWWVGVLWTDPVGLVVAERLPIPKPPPEYIKQQLKKKMGMLCVFTSCVND